MKPCTKCGVRKPLEDFGPDKRRLDGKKSACRNCCRKAQNRYRAENQEHVREIEKKAARRFAEKRPERRREISLKYARANRERISEYGKEYRKRFPDRIRAATQHARAKRAKAPGSHTEADIKRQTLFQRKKCWWCFQPLESYHVDHLIPLSQGGSNGPENIVIACPSCNLQKNRRMPWEFNGRLL